MKRYKEYKDSGIEWIGEIPEHWDVSKFNLYILIRHGHQFMNNDFTPNGVKIVKITQLNKDGYLDLSKCSFVASDRVKEFEDILIKENDILMCLTGGTIGKIIRVGNVKEPLLQNYRVGHFSSARKDKLSDDFIFWLMSSESLLSQIFFQMRETGQPNIGMEDFGKMKITFPRLKEQTQIANYLDHKCTEIDQLIAKKERLIELLQEERTAVINQAVTKGLDPSVPMRDSGIEWLGEIPKHWEVKKLKYVANLKSGDNITSEQIDKNGKYPVYGGNGLRGYYNKYNNDGNFILIGRQGALCGNIKYATNKFWASEHAVVAYLFENNHWIWFGKLLEIMNLNQYSQSAAQPGLSVNEIVNLSIPVPQLEEQIHIVNFIQEEEIRIDSLYNKMNNEIALLKEYKTALISEVVTGKVDVRDEVLV